MKHPSAIILMAILLLCTAACSESKNDTGVSETVSSVSEDIPEISRTESSYQPEEISDENPVSSVSQDVSEISGTESSYEFREDDDDCDALYTPKFENKAFLFFKTHDRLYREKFVFDSESHAKEYSAIMPIENGEFVSVRADGYIMSGGVMGYCDEPFFDKINSQEKLTPEQAVEQFNIPEARDVKRLFSLDTVMKHTIGNRMYIIFQAGSFDVYLDSNLAGTAPYDKVCGGEGETDPEKRMETLIEFVEELDRSGQAG